MAYRDDKVVLKQRIDRLELSLARTSGRAILLEEERDAALAELANLQRDPVALAQARKHAESRSSLFAALRVVGGLLFAAGIAPMVIMAFFFLSSGETTLALICSAVPWAAVVGMLALKLPGIVRWLELRAERRQRAARAAEITRDQHARAARVRVDVDELEETFEQADAQADALEDDAQRHEASRRRGSG